MALGGRVLMAPATGVVPRMGVAPYAEEAAWTADAIAGGNGVCEVVVAKPGCGKEACGRGT